MTIQLVEAEWGRFLVPDTDRWQYGYLWENDGKSYDWDSMRDVVMVLGTRPRGMMLDIGASFGVWSFAMAAHVERIVAFEPQLAAYRLLSASIEVNGLADRMTAQHCAVAEDSG